MVRIAGKGWQAEINQGKWVASSPAVKKAVEATARVLFPVTPLGYDPSPDETVARAVAEKLGATVTAVQRKPTVKGTIY